MNSLFKRPHSGHIPDYPDHIVVVDHIPDHHAQNFGVTGRCQKSYASCSCGACMYVCMYVCMYDYIAVSTRTLTPPTTETD